MTCKYQPKQKALEIILWSSRGGCLLGKLLEKFQKYLPEEATQAQIIALMQYGVKEHLIRCYLGTHPDYAYLESLKETPEKGGWNFQSLQDFQCLENPQYWQWPVAVGQPCCVVETTLRGYVLLNPTWSCDYQPAWVDPEDKDLAKK